MTGTVQGHNHAFPVEDDSRAIVFRGFPAPGARARFEREPEREKRDVEEGWSKVYPATL